MDRRFWKKRFKRIASCVLAFSMTSITVGVTAGCLMTLQGCFNEQGQEQSEDVKNSYTFTYDLNYEGSRNRTISVGAGKKAGTYNATRFGYVLEGWFCEKDCKTPYDFSSAVNKDTTIYALWTDESTIVYYNVTFNYGDGITTVERVREGRVVPTYSVLSSQKVGYEIVGWYLDEAFTQEFVLGVTPVNNSVTLYAKYVQKEDVKYTDDGDFDFENVEITIAFKDNHSTKDKAWVKSLLEEFNQAYENRISISIAGEKDKPTLWFDATSALNAKKGEVYAMEDALEIAGKTFYEEEYYDNWINDCYIDDVLYSMPVASFVPVIGYNRSLMNTYNGGVEPTDHESFMDLLNRVHNGESGKEGWVSTVSMSNSWDRKEIVMNNFYIQNNLPLYTVGTEGKMANQWLQDETTQQRALNSINWFRDMFLKYGSKGKITGSAWASGKQGVDWTWVGNGKSFMGIMGSPNLQDHFRWRVEQSEKTLWTNIVGAMPISYFFATEGNEETSQRILVQNYSLAIPKYGNSQTDKIAAAAIFADFASKYCDEACESYLYPANKLAQYNAFNSLTRHWCTDYILKKSGDPNNFYTYPGATYEYNVIVDSQSSFLIDNLCWLDDNATDDVVFKEIQTFCNKINKEMGA